MKFRYQHCVYCGEEYQPYALEPFEMQIKDCGEICKKCLDVMVEENYREVDEELKCGQVEKE